MIPQEALAYDFTIELMRHHGVGDVTYQRAVTQWEAKGVIELTALIGYFATVCWIMNVARTPGPDGTALGGFPG